MTTPRTLLTAGDLAAMPDDGRRFELLDGQLVEVAPSNPVHNWILVNLVAPLAVYVRAGRLGFLMGGDTGIYLRRNPDRVRAPDVCFFAASKFPEGRPPSSYTDIIPDFVVEIVSPSATAADVQQKIEEWLAAGVGLVWAVYPTTRSIAVYRGLADVRVCQESEILDGDPVFPEFTLPVAGLFS